MKFCEKSRAKLPYVENSWDCDDTAREFRVSAAKWAALAWTGAPYALGVGTAIVRVTAPVEGLFPTAPPLGELHAMIVLRRADGGWIFIDPSYGKWIPVEGPLYEGTLEVLKIEL